MTNLADMLHTGRRDQIESRTGKDGVLMYVMVKVGGRFEQLPQQLVCSLHEQWMILFDVIFIECLME